MLSLPLIQDKTEKYITNPEGFLKSDIQCACVCVCSWAWVCVCVDSGPYDAQAGGFFQSCVSRFWPFCCL